MNVVILEWNIICKNCYKNLYNAYDMYKRYAIVRWIFIFFLSNPVHKNLYKSQFIAYNYAVIIFYLIYFLWNITKSYLLWKKHYFRRYFLFLKKYSYTLNCLLYSSNNANFILWIFECHVRSIDLFKFCMNAWNQESTR